MKKPHEISDEIIDFIGEENLEDLYARHGGSHRFTLGGLMKTKRKRDIFRLSQIHPVETIPPKVGLSERQVFRILESK